MAPPSSRRKRAASQVLVPQRAPRGRLSSSSLTRNTPRTKVTPKKGQANGTEASPIAVEVSDDEVDFLDEDDIGINKDKNCGSPTTIPPGKEGFILAGILPPDYPLDDYKVAQLATQTSPRQRRRSRKVVENEEVSSQRSSKQARKKILKKPKPYKKLPPQPVHKSLRTILAERRATEAAAREESPSVSSEAASEPDTMQEPEPELEPEVDSEIIRYTLTWRAVVGATPLANTAKRVHIYGGFVYFQLIAWINEVWAKYPGRFEPIALIQAAAFYNRGTKKDEVIIDLHSHKDIQAMDSVLDA